MPNNLEASEMALKGDQGSHGGGGGTEDRGRDEQKDCKIPMENEEKKNSYCSHTVLLYMKTVHLIILAPSDSFKRALLFSEIYSGFVDR